jgi:hypothetical protein
VGAGSDPSLEGLATIAQRIKYVRQAETGAVQAAAIQAFRSGEAAANTDSTNDQKEQMR